jgi:uncharacterized protein YdeI (YjbR/CyaY-like superfamily)
MMEPDYFASPAEFRQWLERHHATATEVMVGFYKKGTGQPSLTWPESVDEALCFGWIDGVRRRVDDERYTIRFTPRQPRSVWSAVNLKRAAELKAAGRMTPAGLAAYENRDPAKAQRYSYENRPDRLDPPLERTFKADKAAWKNFQAEPAGYRRTAIWWVVSAKKEETRRKRLGTLIAVSREGQRLPQLETRKSK